MIEDMQMRNLSPRTQETYLLQVSLFARYFHRSPALLGPEEIRAYQIYLSQEKTGPQLYSAGHRALALSLSRQLAAEVELARGPTPAP
jgi:hypothetical protein